MHFLQTFVMQDSWKDSEMINTRYCAGQNLIVLSLLQKRRACRRVRM